MNKMLCRVQTLLLWSSAFAALASPTRSQPAVGQPRRYLVPLMMHGPNNQINAIKETLALSAVLSGWSVVLPDLQTHAFTDGGGGGVGGNRSEVMRFRELFNVPLIQSRFNVVLLDELPYLMTSGSASATSSRSWNRTMDAVLLMVRPDQARFTSDLARSLGLQPPPSQDHWHPSPLTAWLGCSAARVAQLRSLLLPYRVVGVQTFHGLVYGSHWLAGPLLAGPRTDACCRAFQSAAQALRMSPLMRALATGFVAQRLGGGGGSDGGGGGGGEPSMSYIAVHLRPYPDTCLEVWVAPEGAPRRKARLAAQCNNDYLMDRFVPSIRHLMAAYNIGRVFMMTHPMVRQLVQKMLGAAGVTSVVFMELDDLMRAAEAHQRSIGGGVNGSSPHGGDGSHPHLSLTSPLSFSLLAMVEQAVCALAPVFVGTKESSMTGTIVQERLAAHLPPGDTYAFFRRSGYQQRPVSLPDFYRLANFTPGGSERWRQRLGSLGVDVDGSGAGRGREGRRGR